jgi:NADP-dependent 3-hydroxy acid dehydrogenase YdfG
MGLATAKVVGQTHTVVLCDVRQDRLDDATAMLKDLGIAPIVVNCDVTDRPGVNRLLATAADLGKIASVIHTAGVSPAWATPTMS